MKFNMVETWKVWKDDLKVCYVNGKLLKMKLWSNKFGKLYQFRKVWIQARTLHRCVARFRQLQGQLHGVFDRLEFINYQIPVEYRVFNYKNPEITYSKVQKKTIFFENSAMLITNLLHLENSTSSNCELQFIQLSILSIYSLITSKIALDARDIVLMFIERESLTFAAPLKLWAY